MNTMQYANHAEGNRRTNPTTTTRLMDLEREAFLRTASEATCARVLDEVGEGELQCASWEPRRAPGNQAAAADDARCAWTVLDGWTKMTVPFCHANPEGGDTFTNTLYGWVSLPFPSEPGPIRITRNLALPDQWAVDRDYHHAWYLLDADPGELPADELWMRFDAVTHACTVFVNGRLAGAHVGGFTPFDVNLTPWMQSGRNTIALCVQDDTAVVDIERKRAVSQLGLGKGIHNAQHAGLRGGVYLEARPATHVSRTRVRTSTREQTLQVETWLRGPVDSAQVSHTVHEWPNGEVAVQELPCQSVSVRTGAEDDGDLHRVHHAVPWPDAKRWSPEHPCLYVLRTTVTANGRSETVETRFGFREFWIEDDQFMLNGTPIRLFGDSDVRRELFSIVPGAARDFDRRVLDFVKRKFNYMSIRLHCEIYPRWATLAADEVGLLVITQSGLNSSRKDWYRNGGEEFMRNTEREFAEWYWRDVNSPSVVIWDLENELIRGKRTPDFVEWVLDMDRFIKQLDPEAIVEHSGAAWIAPQQELIHVHMQEQYSRVLHEWAKAKTMPLVLGEFWMGGGGETRLPNSYEYSDREDWHREEARLYREKILEMRNVGASGIMSHRMTHWPLVRSWPMLSRDELDKLDRPPYRWRFKTVRAEGARGMAPVVGFVWPRVPSVAADAPFTREVVVCNDRERKGSFKVSCTYGEQRREWEVSVEPGAQWRGDVRFDPASLPGGDVGRGTAGRPGLPPQRLCALTVEVREADGVLIESDEMPIHPIPRAVLECPRLQRRLVVVPSPDSATTAALDELGLGHDVADELPTDAAGTLVIVPPGAPADALGKNDAAARRYLESGGRILVLAQDKAPRWLPADVPFSSAARITDSYDRAGFKNNSKARNYNRDVPVYGIGHPVFTGLDPCDFKEWDPFDGRVGDDVFVRPNAAHLRAGAPYRVLLGGTRREYGSLTELTVGRGTLMLCQAHALRLRKHPAARALLFNLLRYLDGPACHTSRERVGVLGKLSAAKMAALTGLDPDRFVANPAPADPPRLVVAGDGADEGVIHSLAEAGSTVLVLSCETSNRLPGFVVEQDEELYYSGTRRGIEDHALFWGVAGGSFLPLEQTPAMGALRKVPRDARILLAGHGGGHSPLCNDWKADIGFYGLESREATPPLAAVRKVGEGEIIATTLEPWERTMETHRQLLVSLLANAGVRVPCASRRTSRVAVKRTVPLVLDGKLDDWTNDIDDINLSTYSHAVPIPLTGYDAVTGRVAGDLDLSALLYFLYSEGHLYMGGIVFSGRGAVRLEARVSEMVVCVDVDGQSVALNGEEVPGENAAFGEQAAVEVIDTQLLNLTVNDNRTGKVEVPAGTAGRTFELAIDWHALGTEHPPAELAAQLKLERDDGTVLCVPATGAPDGETLTLRLERSTAASFFGKEL